MKKQYSMIFLALLAISAAHAQTLPADVPRLLQEADGYYYGINKPFNPGKAFALYQSCANAGDARAMYALGVQYSKGAGVAVNYQLAMQWLQQAVQKGNAKACYQLAMLYKKGRGTSQNFEKAYQLFAKGAELKDEDSRYMQAYMMYKGLGCAQNYKQAYELFYEGAQKDNAACMYYTGLCLRNGYGISRNTGEAHRWLERSADMGYEQSREELKITQPENYLAVNATTDVQYIDNASAYKRIKHNATPEDLSGTFTGTATRYDWSGQYIISQTPVSLSLTKTDNRFDGTWEENGATIPVHAVLTDKGLMFYNSLYSKTDHYSGGKPMQWEIRKGQIEIVKLRDSVYLTGNLQMYSPLHQEPGKPFTIKIAKWTPVHTEISSVNLNAFPAPFYKNFQVSFDLSETSRVNIKIVNTNGQTVYNDNTETLMPGKYTRSITLPVPNGVYMLSLIHNNQNNTIKIIKQ